MNGDVDLNLLRVLDALLDEGSVAGAAVRLNLSAPAVSRALGRLRRVLDDPLFVRSGRGLVATPFAIALQADVRSALTHATAVLQPAAETFDASNLDRVFCISAGDAIVSAIAVSLTTALRQAAPAVEVSFLPDTNEVELLRTGRTDLDIGSPAGFGNEIDHETLLVDNYVVAIREGHPIGERRVTAKRLANADHVSVSSHGSRGGELDRSLAEVGMRRRSVTVVSSFLVAAHLIAESDLIGVVPRSVVRTMQPALGLEERQLPVAVRPVTVTQSWHRRNANDPAHRWLRQSVRALVTTGAGHE